MNKWSKLSKDIYPTVLLDNDIGKVGTSLNDVPIDSVSNIRKYLEGSYEIIITTAYVSEITSQLHGMNIYENIIDYIEKDKEISKLYLEKNADLHDKKTSKRCFIIGTGPSLKDLDLQLLMNDDKIMVNHLYKNENLMELNPNFWVIADPAFWLQEKRFLDPIIDALRNKLTSTQFLIPDEALSHVTRDLISERNIYHYRLDKSANYESHTIDFTGVVPLFAQNVISAALMLAIYLKYEEIILIGCDHSWWAYSKEEIESGISIPHYYKENAKNVEYIANVIKDIGYQGLQETIRVQKKEYEALRRIAAQNGIHVCNATPGGYLESFPRKGYQELF